MGYELSVGPLALCYMCIMNESTVHSQHSQSLAIGILVYGPSFNSIEAG